MIKIATAECFTHGKIGRELHALAQDYKGNFGRNYIKNPKDYGDFNYDELSVTCSLFIPTIEAVEKILNVKNPPKHNKLIKGIKVYDEKGEEIGKSGVRIYAPNGKRNLSITLKDKNVKAKKIELFDALSKQKIMEKAI